MNTQWQMSSREQDSMSVEFKDGSLSSLQRKNTCSRLLKLIENQKLSVVSGEKLSTRDQLIDSARELVPYGEKAEYSFQKPSSFAKPEPLQSAFVAGLDLDSMKDLASEIVKRARERQPQFSYECTISRFNQAMYLENSLGLDQNRIFSEMQISLVASRMLPDEIFYWDESFSGLPQSMQEIEQRLGLYFMELDSCLHTEKLNSGVYPCLFHPKSLHFNVFAPFFAALEPASLENKTSFLLDKKNQKILSTQFHLSEEARHINFDQDGLEAGPRLWVEEGVLRHHPVPLSYSVKLNQEPNASSFDAGPFSDLTLRGGSKSSQELIQGIERGILFLTSYNLDQGDITQGHLSGIISKGFCIQNGKIIGRLKGNNLAFNFYKAFGEDLQTLSSDHYRFGSSAFEQYPFILSQVQIS